MESKQRKMQKRYAMMMAQQVEVADEFATAKKENRRARWRKEWGDPKRAEGIDPATYGLIRANKKH